MQPLLGLFTLATLLTVSVILFGCNNSDGEEEGMPGKDDNETTPKQCVVMGTVMKSWDDCAQVASTEGKEIANASGGVFNWACVMEGGSYAITDGEKNKLLIWDAKTNALSDPISLGELTVPVGCTYLDGKIYVAGFGTWPVPTSDSGVAVVDAATKTFESFHEYTLDNKSHVHNVYTFSWGGKKEIFVAAMGNPWTQQPVTGQGIVRFDRGSNSYDSATANVRLNCRSAVQADNDAWYVLTQEPSGQQTKLVRLERSDKGFKEVAEELLPARDGGDGGADVFLNSATGVVFATDRSDSGGNLYAYMYSSGNFSKLSEHTTGNHPRHTAMTRSGDVISCNQKGNDISRFPGLVSDPKTQVEEQRSRYVMNKPSFVLEVM